jgi:hypothetical protein
MARNSKKMACAEFEALLPELRQAGEDPTLHPHPRECEKCRQLAIDLETIAKAARKLFPADGPWIN